MAPHQLSFNAGTPTQTANVPQDHPVTVQSHIKKTPARPMAATERSMDSMGNLLASSTQTTQKLETPNMEQPAKNGKKIKKLEITQTIQSTSLKH